MKSIVEEASSITKAIEKAWLRAQKPREFSIKIFEEAETNFFGMTKKPAKIGFFYKEELPAAEHGRGQQRSNVQRRPFNKRPNTGQVQGSRDEHRNDSRSADSRREHYNAPRSQAGHDIRTENRQHPRQDNRQDGRPAHRDERREQQHQGAPRQESRPDYRQNERREQQPNTQAPHDAAQTQDGQPRPQRRRRRFRRGRGGQGGGQGGQSQNAGESRSNDGGSSEE